MITIMRNKSTRETKDSSSKMKNLTKLEYALNRHMCCCYHADEIKRGVAQSLGSFSAREKKRDEKNDLNLSCSTDSNMPTHTETRMRTI